MSSPRWRKVLRDLWLHLPRALLVILATALGIFGVGSFLVAYAVLTPTIETNFAITNPAAITLRMNAIDESIVQRARNFPGVTAAEARRTVYARVEIRPNEWGIMILSVVSDFNHLQVNKFWSESGTWPVGDHQILIERASIPYIHATQGDTIVVKTPRGTSRELPITGLVFDPGQAPAWVDGVSYGYITPGTLQWLGGPSTPFNELLISVNKGASSQQIRAVADRLAAALEQDGYPVASIRAAPPAHPHNDQMNSFMFLLEAFAGLSLLLSGVLTATLISAVLSQQIRQIGVMKAIGARTHQVMGIYFGAVLILSLIALVIAIPLAVLAGQGYARSAAGLLNFNILNNAIPLWVFLVQVALGILVPLLTAVYPVYRGSRITVREAINDYGITTDQSGTGRFDTLLGRMQHLSRPLALSLRNVFRRRMRMIMTLLMLAVGGTSFMAALGSATSWNQTINDTFAHDHYDLDIRFEQPYAADALAKSIRAIPGVTTIETWGSVPVVLQYADGSDENKDTLQIMAPPPAGTTLIDPLLVEGRWLQPEDTNAIVIPRSVAQPPDGGPQLHAGDDLTLYLNGSQKTVWHVVGIVPSELEGGVYASYHYLAEITRQQGLAGRALVAVKDHDPTLQTTVSQTLEQRLAEDGFSVVFLQKLSTKRQVLFNHIIIMLVLLMVISIMLIAIGAMGLASTMSVNVMERTREIGMMRAIGASTSAIMQIIIAEGTIISVLSWLPGCLVAVPVTVIVGTLAGEFFLKRPLELAFPFWIPLLWLAIVLVVAVVASLSPAWSAARLTVREVLAYE